MIELRDRFLEFLKWFAVIIILVLLIWDIALRWDKIIPREPTIFIFDEQGVKSAHRGEHQIFYRDENGYIIFRDTKGVSDD